MKIYTKTGDTGQTDLFEGGRLPKDAPRMHVLGEIDELNSTLGVVRSFGLKPDEDVLVESIQQQMFLIGSELACIHPERMGVQRILESDVAMLETKIDFYSESLTPLRSMLCSTGSPVCAFCQLARAVCRRVERQLVTLARQPDTEVSPLVLAYFNRLSDFLFVLGRFLGQ